MSQVVANCIKELYELVKFAAMKYKVYASSNFLAADFGMSYRISPIAKYGL